MLSNQCISCAHYRGFFQCDAFPRRIPQSILTGEVDHSTPRRGDHGIQFAPLIQTVAAAGHVDHSDGCMIALYPRPEEAAAICVDDGQMADDLHVTLAFLPEPPDFDLAAEACQAAAATCSGILAGEIGGTGAFRTPPDGPCPQIALPDVVGLNELRAALVRELDARGVVYARNHGFTPHVTVAYADEHAYPDPSCHGCTLTFDALTLKIGRDRYDFALAPTAAPEQEEPMATAQITAEDDTMTAASVTITVADDEETEVEETETEEPPEEMTVGGPWRASLCIEGAPTEDGRLLERGSISWRALPLSLMGLLDTGPGGHQGASVCGRIDRIWRDEDTIWGEGVFSGAPFGQEVETAVRDRMVDGVSVDLAILDFEVRDAETMAVLGPEEQVDAMLAGRKVLFAVTDAVIGMATVCPMQAIEGAKIESLVAAGQPTIRVRFTFQHPDETVTASASGYAPELPPADWFTDPELDGPTPLTITDDGRVFGHAALWGSCHTAYTGRCVTPPRDDDYSLFHLGEIQTAEGDRVHVGQITMRTGHAPVHLNQAAAVEHYDHTGVAAADVRCGNDEHGIWVAGAVRPNLSLAQLREFTGAKVSGDWRRMQGGPWQMLGLLAVNIPGYPVPRPQALVASGDDGVEETVTVLAAGVVPTSFDRASKATIRALAARAAGGLNGLIDLTRQ